jgi:predicted transcriptional regulator
LPVVDEERLVGIVTLQNLMHSIGVLAESKKIKRDSGEKPSVF